jgi:hypothetical protein
LQGRPSLVEIPKGITHADLRSRLCEAAEGLDSDAARTPARSPNLMCRPGGTTLRGDCPQAWSPRLGWRQHRRLARDGCLDGWFRQRSILEPQRPFGEPLDSLFGCGQGQPLDPVLGVLAGLSTKLLLVLGEGGRPP